LYDLTHNPKQRTPENQLGIFPFENLDFSQYRDSLDAASYLFGLEAILLSAFYLSTPLSQSEITRKQRDAVRVITLSKDQFAEADNAPGYRLIVTNQDLFAINSSSIFGLANFEMKIGIMSVFRLAQWQEDVTPSKIQERIMKEASHQIGHLIGLGHCELSSCIMSPSQTLEQLDSRLPMLCRNCAKVSGNR
jgi:archaemetzincin